ncbi:hypothetical protein [Treponema phagedenis]|uniref:hypothetical protein n=1 Tax=Treponema phagedenis TaxID=162 RepID=UPI0001F63A67|nr:hypothetical protein [Treponema phagedenis]EFW38981.1 hypothetical protein HMPREF9554_00504 [Treponema phagedenis F0421]TYT76431.1 hypothetical protein FS559_15620 [Treponema phagedenis]TYT76556.1 hypothetical protein FS559_13920 [Treponema phagedenis]TYT76849.1 hypothetical protein FS559_13155 [Treponema phagedenis]TYT77706.1 hypothetical protein FS559_00475 [Treponema phagedenis]
MSNKMFNLPANPANIPPSGKQAGTSRTQSIISVFDIKNFISPKLYSELSWDEDRAADEVTQDCINRAEELAETLLHLVGEKINPFSRTQKEVLKILTVYELYTYNGDRIKAKEYMERAERLISDRYRSIEKEREAVLPEIALINPKSEKVKK